jgi:hypothetical protein
MEKSRQVVSQLDSPDILETRFGLKRRGED